MAKEKKETTTSVNIFEKVAPILLVATIGLAFTVGILWEKVRNLEGGGTRVANNQAPNVDPAAAPPAAGKLSEAEAAKIPAISEKDHIRGSRNAKVFFVEYSDLECPFCQQFHPTVKAAVESYGQDVAWVYRHYPLDMLHPKARPAAEASECVAEVGGADAFWQFVDKVFENQQANLVDISATAVSVGVNKARFDECVSSGRMAGVVDEQYQGGSTAGITGTPGSFVINQKGEAWLIPGAYPLESLKQTIDEALAS